MPAGRLADTPPHEDACYAWAPVMRSSQPFDPMATIQRGSKHSAPTRTMGYQAGAGVVQQRQHRRFQLRIDVELMGTCTFAQC